MDGIDAHGHKAIDDALRHLLNGRVTRRTVLGAALAAGASAALAGCGTGGSAQSQSTYQGSLIYRRATYHDDEFQKYLKVFDQQYKRKSPTTLSSIYTNYHQVTETQMLGGSRFDVVMGDPGYLGKWYHAGLIQPIDDLPGLDKLKSNMYPSAIPDLTAPDGKMAGLPYFTAVEGFFYNTEMFDKANLTPPKTWSDVIEAARTLKGKGIAPVPFAPKWSAAFGAGPTQFVNMAFSEGMEQLFDKKLNPTYDSDPAAIRALGYMKTLYSEQLVPADVLTYATQDAANNFTAQKSAMFQYETYYGPIFNASGSPIAGKARMILMPGKTHHVWAQQDAHMVCTKTHDKASAMELARFLAGTDKNGHYTVPLNLYLLSFGLVVPYKSINNDPRVVNVTRTYTDPQLFKEHMSLTKSIGHAITSPWFAQWQDNLGTAVQQAITGSKEPAAALKASADFVRSQHK